MTKKRSKIASVERYNLGLGDLLRQYELDQTLLGQGQFGKVFKASHKTDKNRKFAIKTINKKKLNKEDIENVYNEINVMLKLDHPNIVKYHETYDDVNYIYLVMELLDKNLENVLKERLK